MTLVPPGAHGKPATGLFPRLRSRDDVERQRLRDDQVRSFEENGYVAGIRVLEGATLDAVREAVERIQRGESPRLEDLYEVEEDYDRDPAKNAFHCLGAWRVEPALRELLPNELRDRFRPVPIPLRAGEASLHHPLTVHGSYGNQSPRPRRAVVLNYMAPDTRSAEGRIPLLKGTPVVPRGAVIDGAHF